MKKIMTLALLISLLGCRYKSYRQNLNSPTQNSDITDYSNDNTDDEILKLLYGDSVSIKKESKPKSKVVKNQKTTKTYLNSDTQNRIGTKEWREEAKRYLSLEEGETMFVRRKKINSKKINNNSYSTKDIEYSEEWKVRAYKATKEHLKSVIPKSLPNCYINSFGYYNSHYVQYIGNNTFRVKVYLTIKCGNDDYENRKYFWFETGDSEHTNEFEFYFIKQKFAD